MLGYLYVPEVLYMLQLRLQSHHLRDLVAEGNQVPALIKVIVGLLTENFSQYFISEE